MAGEPAVIHRFIHGRRTCRCGGLTVPQPEPRVKGQLQSLAEKHAARRRELQAVEASLAAGGATEQKKRRPSGGRPKKQR